MQPKKCLLAKYWNNTSCDEEYLRDIVIEGACERYGEDWSDELADRIDYELRYIENAGYEDYFLIVADYVQHARKIGREETRPIFISPQSMFTSQRSLPQHKRWWNWHLQCQTTAIKNHE